MAVLDSTRRMLLGISAAAACSLVLAGPAAAATITADTVADNLTVDGSCTFREAIQATNTNTTVDSCVHDAGTGPDTIQLNTFNYKIEIPGTGEEGNLTGDFDIDAGAGLTIDGAGSAIIDGDDLDRVLHLSDGTLTLTDSVQVTDGTAPTSGGGILTQGSSNLNITDSTVNLNAAPNGGAGIQVSSTGTATLTGASVSQNQVTASLSGGGGIGVSSTGGASNLMISNSRINNNTVDGSSGIGAGLAFNPNLVSTLSVSNSLIDNNTATSTTSVSSGGANVNAPDGSTVSFTQSAVRNNLADGSGAGAPSEAAGIRFNNGGGTVTDSVIRDNEVDVDGAGLGNRGGGILIGSDTVRIVRSTVSGNFLTDGVQSGGAIVNEATLVLLNSTISTNSAPLGSGGGLHQADAGASTTAVNTSFVNNDAGSANAINRTAGTVTVRGSILDNFGQAGSACAGTITSAGFNVGSDSTCSLAGTGDEQGVVVGLLGLGDYGLYDPSSPTNSPRAGPPSELEALNTHQPQTDSTVRDQIPAASCTDDGGVSLLANDQRGVPRPFDGNDPVDSVADCDAGSVESALCRGAEATLVGTAAGETITGAVTQDVIAGAGGNDTLNGGSNGDRLCGNDGNDTLNGGDTASPDLFDGGTGADDEVTYASHSNAIDANLTSGNTSGAGGDTFAFSTVENLRGGSGENTFTGDGASNELRGGGGQDFLKGEEGDDLLDGEAHPGPDLDVADFSSAGGPVTANLLNGTATGQGSDMLLNVEAIQGGPFGDTLTGDNNAVNWLFGGGGFDTLTGLGGFDDLEGQADGSTIFARDGVSDSVDCGAGASDSAEVDAPGIDIAPSNCETLSFPPATPPATNTPTPTTPATPAPAPKKCKKGQKLKKGKCVKKKKKK